jgi:hypothetical protein
VSEALKHLRQQDIDQMQAQIAEQETTDPPTW